MIPRARRAAPLLHQLPMLGIMAWAMAGGHSVTRSISAGLACALISIGYAPASRTSIRARAHILDLWAMALLFIAPLIAVPLITPDPAVAPMHGHAASPAGTPLVVAAAIAIGWAAARLLLLRERPEKTPATTAATASTAVSAVTVAVMVFSCP